jgi:hypothetical protein
MKRFFLGALATVLLAGCDKPMNRLEVVVVDPSPISADAYLCDRPAEALPWKTDRYLLLRPADCRGAGRVVVTFKDGAAVTCPIKIVVTGTPSWYRWRLEGRHCAIR